MQTDFILTCAAHDIQAVGDVGHELLRSSLKHTHTTANQRFSDGLVTRSPTLVGPLELGDCQHQEPNAPVQQCHNGDAELWMSEDEMMAGNKVCMLLW